MGQKVPHQSVTSKGAHKSRSQYRTSKSLEARNSREALRKTAIETILQPWAKRLKGHQHFLFWPIVYVPINLKRASSINWPCFTAGTRVLSPLFCSCFALVRSNVRTLCSIHRLCIIIVQDRSKFMALFSDPENLLFFPLKTSHQTLCRRIFALSLEESRLQITVWYIHRYIHWYFKKNRKTKNWKLIYRNLDPTFFTFHPNFVRFTL